MDVDALVTGLDADQRRAVIIDAQPLAIIAAAGSGKTTVLTRRIAHRVVSDPAVHAQHVLALTFTSQAAHELQRRLRQIGLRDRVEAGTFHAVALRLLRQRAIDAGQRPPAVASDRSRLVAEALRSIGSSVDPAAMLNELDWIRARRVSTADYADASRRAGRRPAVTSPDLSSLAEAYTNLKRRKGVVDFDDLLESSLSAMQTDKMWAAGVRWRFRHLFVDEAQDLNPLQHALLESIRNDRADLCLVGDPRQAIFGFNGSDPAIMNDVERLYPGITIVRLQRNYRCSPQIIEAARRVLQHADQADDSIAVAADGPKLQMIACEDDAAENVTVARVVREMASGNRPWRSCAVLARTTAQLTAVGRALDRAGVPFVARGRANTTKALGTALAEAYAQRTPSDLGAWVEVVNAQETTGSVHARVAETVDRFLAQSTGLSLRAWVELHSPFDDLEEDQRVDAIELLTFHGAKGREWPFVVVIGAENGLVPHSSAVTPVLRDEEARLLYVACTRAREQLVITWALRRHDRNSKPSPWIEGIAVDGSDDVAPPPVKRPPREQPDHVFVALVNWRRNAAKAAQVEPSSICSDEALRAVAQARPSTVEAVAALTDLGPLAAARIAPRILAALSQVT